MFLNKKVISQQKQIAMDRQRGYRGMIWLGDKDWKRKR
jgi:hypothetical protein